MAKRVDVPASTLSGQPASPQIKLIDIQRTGLFSRANLGELVRDIVGEASSEEIVMGGQAQIAAAMQIDVFPPLSVYRTADGVIFSLYSETPVTLTIDTADTTNPRIDLIVATMHESDAMNSGLRHFRQNPPVPGATEGDVTVSDEKWDRLTISVVKGTADVVPLAPALPTDSVLLYTVNVPALTVALTDVLLTDVRLSVMTQQKQDELIAALQAIVNKIKSSFTLPIGADQVLILAGAGKYSGLTDQDAWASLGNQNDELGFDPITRPQTMTADGKVGGLANQQATAPVVDIPIGIDVAFSNVIRRITQNTIPASLNPRVVNLSGSAGTQTDIKDTSPLTLASILSIESDGGGRWWKQTASTPSIRIATAAAGRDSRYIEAYGGQSVGGGELSDWFTYDTVAKTIIPRGLTGTVPPAAGRPAMFSCGDNRHLLLATSNIHGGTPRWFLVDTNDFSCVEKFGGPTVTPDLTPQPYQKFVGDLVQTGIIVICAIGNLPSSNEEPEVRTFWKYDVTAGTFTQLAVSGSVPNGKMSGTDACLYQTGKLVLFQNDARFASSGKTFIFDYGTLTWVQQNITQPTDVFSASGAASITNFRFVNIGGTPQLFGGSQFTDGTFQTTSWFLTPAVVPSWVGQLAFLPPTVNPGGASLLVGGLQKGTGYALGGFDPVLQKPHAEIDEFRQGGVIETVLNGVPGLTLAPGTRQAVIRIADYQVNLSNIVSKVLLSLAGSIPAGSVVVNISLNDGVSFQTIPRDKVTAVLASSNPGHRQLKLTLYSQGSSAPIITGIHEVFEVTGGPGLNQTYIRFDVPAGTNALYIKRDGSMEMLSDISPTTPDRGILLKVTHNGTGVNPSVKNFVNMRRFIIENSGAKGGSNPTFDYDGAVAPTFIRAVGVTGGATGAVYRIAKPTMNFDSTITVTGLSASADFYYVEATA